MDNRAQPGDRVLRLIRDEPPEPEVNQQLIECLEDLLERARTGEVQKIGVIFGMPGGDWDTCYSGATCSELYTMFGAGQQDIMDILRHGGGDD